MSSKVYTEAEVAEHNTLEDCWIILGNKTNGGKKVVDVSKYLNDHPGGPEIITEYAGKDADHMFEDIGHSSEARQTMKKFVIGDLAIDPNAPVVEVSQASVKSSGGLNPLAVVVLLIAIAVGYYFSQLKN